MGFFLPLTSDFVAGSRNLGKRLKVALGISQWLSRGRSDQPLALPLCIFNSQCASPSFGVFTLTFKLCSRQMKRPKMPRQAHQDCRLD